MLLNRTLSINKINAEACNTNVLTLIEFASFVLFVIKLLILKTDHVRTHPDIIQPFKVQNYDIE
jgi:hypothetical protein